MCPICTSCLKCQPSTSKKCASPQRSVTISNNILRYVTVWLLFMWNNLRDCVWSYMHGLFRSGAFKKTIASLTPCAQRLFPSNNSNRPVAASLSAPKSLTCVCSSIRALSRVSTQLLKLNQSLTHIHCLSRTQRIWLRAKFATMFAVSFAEFAEHADGREPKSHHFNQWVRASALS